MGNAVLGAIGELEQKINGFRHLLIERGVAIEPNLYMELRDQFREVEAAVHGVRSVATEADVGGADG